LRECGIEARANARIVDIGELVERGGLKPAPRHVTDLWLN